MDVLLSKIGNQAINLALKSGVAFTSGYAYQQCSRLLKTVNDKAIHAELKALQKTLDSKVKILSPAIDLIEFKSGRGNVFLESAVPLAKSLHRDIVRLGKQLDDAATSEEVFRHATAGRRTSMSDTHRAKLTLIIKDIKALIARIDRDIPLIHLAITNSGERMNSTLSPGISPSRMMQASWLLNYADLQFVHDPSRPVQIGPSFTLSLYMLFLGHSKARTCNGNGGALPSPEFYEGETSREEPYGLGEGERKPIWQEVMHKARVRLCRTPAGWGFERSRGYRPLESPDLAVAEKYSGTSATAVLAQSDQYSYHLEIIEDLDDGRLHEEGTNPDPFDDITMAGIRESVPVHQISKIFYTDTGRLLNIRGVGDGDNNPVLLLKRDANAQTPIRLRQEWFENSEDPEYQTEDESVLPDDQIDVDQQLREESELAEKSAEPRNQPSSSNLPAHLDPEWLALEVFADDDDSQASEHEDEEEDEEKEKDSDTSDETPSKPLTNSRPGVPRDRSSVDSNLVDQLKNISFGAGPSGGVVSRLSSSDVEHVAGDSTESRIAKSPFGSVVTSLSLLEMLVRLTSLQEFQQTPHLSIPDHILTFFLDETSTTGLQGEAHWALRNEAKRRVGFDPYTDTHPK